MREEKGLITAQVLAEALSLSVDTVWKYTRDGKIPCVQLGKRQYRYRLEDVLAALNEPAVCEGASGCKTGQERFTYDDYLQLPDEPGFRFQVLKGMLIREPSPNVMHQRTLGRLYLALHGHFRDHDPEGEVFCAPLDVTLGEENVVQPDLLFVSSEQKHIIRKRRIDGAPELVAEILSPGDPRRDRLQKLQVYRDAEVPHYWIVDPQQRTLECLALRDGTYAVVGGGMDDDVVCPPDFPGLALNLEDLWR